MTANNWVYEYHRGAIIGAIGQYCCVFVYPVSLGRILGQNLSGKEVSCDDGVDLVLVNNVEVASAGTLIFNARTKRWDYEFASLGISYCILHELFTAASSEPVLISFSGVQLSS
jgi:hypothetical protein